MNEEKDFYTRTAEAYQGRSVLVTGADGFVGSHLVQSLIALGAEVHALVRRSQDNLKHIAPFKDRLILHRADVRDDSQVREAVDALKNRRGSMIFHLAAQAHVGDSWKDPEETLQTNILGTLNLLQAACELKLNLHKFEYAGSSEEYGSFDETRSNEYNRAGDGSVLLDEVSPLNPKSVYATSKVAADFLTRNFYDAYGIPVVVSRMFNNFGPHQSPRFITGTVITQALQRQEVEIGWPGARRDFTFIEDGVRGHLLTGFFGEPGQVYVFGQGKNISIGDWAELIINLGQRHGFWNQRKLIIRQDLYRPGRTDEADLLADPSRLYNLCGWKPEVSWEEGIVRTIRWYAENRPIWEDVVDWKLT